MELVCTHNPDKRRIQIETDARLLDQKGSAKRIGGGTMRDAAKA